MGCANSRSLTAPSKGNLVQRGDIPNPDTNTFPDLAAPYSVENYGERSVQASQALKHELSFRFLENGKTADAF
jgi:hypothetical protein